MIKTRTIAAALLLSIAACTPEAPDEEAAPPEGEVVAVVNDKPISKAHYDTYAERRGGIPEDDEAREALIDDLVSLELLVQQALSDGLDREPELAGELSVQRGAMLAQAAIYEYLEANPVSDEQIQEEYRKYVEGFAGEEYNASHILVEDQAQASELIAAIEGGADFAELAAEHSLDGSGANGGELGWFEPGMMVESFSNAVSAMEVGEISSAPVQSRFGWHIIKLNDRRESTPETLEEMRDEIRNFLNGRVIEAWVEELRETATVEVK